MRTVPAHQIREVYGPERAYSSQWDAFAALGSGVADLPDRLILPGTEAGAGPGDALAFCYAARLRPGTGAVCKFGAVAGGNAALGLPAVHAVVLALDPVTGVPVALLDGDAITELRTAAASAVAVDLLARGDADTLAVIGCGVQGAAHLAALTGRRRYREIRLFDHHPGRADALAAGHPGLPVTVADSAVGAAAGVAVVLLATTGTTPVLPVTAFAPGATVLSLGSFAADRREVPPELCATARVVVDHRPTAVRQAGPVVAALAAGTLTTTDLVELGEVLVGRAVGRRDPAEIVYYNSVGVGVQDAAATWTILAALDAEPLVISSDITGGD
jgi:ornithine cyclodeaminase